MQVKGWANLRPLHFLDVERLMRSGNQSADLELCSGKWNSSGIVNDFGNSSARYCVELWYRSEAAEIGLKLCRRTLANRGFTCDNSAALSLFFAEGVST